MSVQYIPDNTGWIWTGNIETAYKRLTEFGNRYLTKDEVKTILNNKNSVKQAIEKTGILDYEKYYLRNTQFTASTIVSSNNGTTFEDGDGMSVNPSGGQNVLPIAARTFE